ncbi:hypothetical protein D623_10027503 [Myotis brandtii]|uniref:Uncharacterized protein n=1 Tax=Myotis brandtii TaxID=109478 RepID=S7PGZ4_MYOBR|nr:hypothetical protein D623_10027503 [Myotis brandtii]
MSRGPVMSLVPLNLQAQPVVGLPPPAPRPCMLSGFMPEKLEISIPARPMAKTRSCHVASPSVWSGMGMNVSRAKPPPFPILTKSSHCEGSSAMWSKSKQQPTQPQKSKPILGLSNSCFINNSCQRVSLQVRRAAGPGEEPAGTAPQTNRGCSPNERAWMESKACRLKRAPPPASLIFPKLAFNSPRDYNSNNPPQERSSESCCVQNQRIPTPSPFMHRLVAANLMYGRHVLQGLGVPSYPEDKLSIPCPSLERVISFLIESSMRTEPFLQNSDAIPTSSGVFLHPAE